MASAVNDLEKRMQDKRDIACRCVVIDQMTELQLREEKAELQRELTKLEKTFGRSEKFTIPQRQIVKLAYDHFSELKRGVSRLDSR